MLGAVAACVVAATLTVWMALSQPSIGMSLRWDHERQTLLAADLAVESLAAKGGATGQDQAFVLEPNDLIEESDFLDSYEQVARFTERQTEIVRRLQAPAVQLRITEGDGTERNLLVSAHKRMLADLPIEFWLQIFVAGAAFLIGMWVWTLRRGEWGARMLALAGVSIWLFASAAAIYSTRELAIPGWQHRVLSALNHIGALTFGAAMISLFLLYPRQLIAPKRLVWLFAGVAVWLVLDITRLASDPATGNALPTMLEMGGILVCIACQWVATRADPRGRAALRWLGLSVILGAGTFVATVIAPLLLGNLPPMPQGVAFLFFLLIHVGVALGVARYRLFELDEWAFRLLYYTLALLIIAGLDAALVYLLHFEQVASLGLAVVVVAFVWFPLRQKLWDRFVVRRRMTDEEMVRRVVGVTLAPDLNEREQRWRELLQRLFDPLVIASVVPPVTGVEVRDDGMELVLPPCSGSTALSLRNPWGGRGLFGPTHLALAQQITALVGTLEASRDAYDRGVREERHRIAADLHDDVGARLLTTLHRDGLDATRSMIREALADVRAIASGLLGDSRNLSSIAADMRYESAQRLEGAGIDFVWSAAGLDEVLVGQRVYRHLVSAHRELLSNSIRHSGAKTVEVGLSRSGDTVELTVRDDGKGLQEGYVAGHGLINIQRRALTVGGSVVLTPHPAGGLQVRVSLPLR